jgi:hypothetical protein
MCDRKPFHHGIIMPDHKLKLSAKTLAVPEMIAAGNNYDQILAAYPGLTYLDIFNAAKEALDSRFALKSTLAYTLAEVRTRHARAYDKWLDQEDESLRQCILQGMTVAQIAGQFQRRRSAVRSRIKKLDLINLLSAKEQARIRRREEKTDTT